MHGPNFPRCNYRPFMFHLICWRCGPWSHYSKLSDAFRLSMRSHLRISFTENFSGRTTTHSNLKI
ncbi:unnamed protein product [Amoebophrya sp. A120]|nr:unnamed protein product [Amoebophrya sp. A120]|eukprot:GSA120T00003124001.1